MPQLWQKYPTSFHGSNTNSRQKYSNDFLRNSRPILAEVSWFSAEVLTIFGWSTRWLTPELRAISGSMTRVISYRIHAPFATDASVIVSMKVIPIRDRSIQWVSTDDMPHSWQKWSSDCLQIHALLWQKYAMIFYGRIRGVFSFFTDRFENQLVPVVRKWVFTSLR